MSSKKGNEVATDGKPKELPRQIYEDVLLVNQLPVPILRAAGWFPSGHAMKDGAAKSSTVNLPKNGYIIDAD